MAKHGHRSTTAAGTAANPRSVHGLAFTMARVYQSLGQVQQQTSAAAPKDITGQLPVQWPGHLGLNTMAQPTQPAQQQTTQMAATASLSRMSWSDLAQLQMAQQMAQQQQPAQQQMALPQQQQSGQTNIQPSSNTSSNASTSGSTNPSWIESKPNSRVFFYCMLSLGLFMMLLIVFLILKIDAQQSQGHSTA